MKIKYLSDLDIFRLSRTGTTYKNIKTNEYYTFIEECPVCGSQFMKHRKNKTNCCSKACSQSGQRNHQFGKTKEQNGWYGKTHSKETLAKLSKYNKGDNNKAWKGGVVKKNLPLYDTYAHQLDFIENVRPKYKDNLKLIEVKCKKCNKWFIPTRIAVRQRIVALNSVNDCKEHNFYCSDECKNSCDIFHRFGGIKAKRKNEYGLSTWSKEVLKRSNYKCEYCGEKATEAHHIHPKKLEPIYTLDPDNGVACCKKCHIKYCHQNECSFINLANIKCK